LRERGVTIVHAQLGETKETLVAPEIIPHSRRRRRRFGRAVLQGLGIILPPVLTVVVFVWIGSTIERYALGPAATGARNAIAWWTADIRTELPSAEPTAKHRVFRFEGREYVQIEDPSAGAAVYLPYDVYQSVRSNPGPGGIPRSAIGVYRRWVEIRLLRPYVVIPVFLVLFLLALYLLGRFLAAGIGRVLWNFLEGGVNRLPLVRNVYSSVKQVTDFMFGENRIEFTRTVAVEYPRKGIWSLAFVTGEGLRGVRAVAGEPLLTVMVPTSPMPVTGYTIVVRKSETVELSLTIDQAVQYIISCGVLVAPHQLRSLGYAPPLSSTEG